MPQKAIYIKDKNVELYEKAEKKAGKSFSELIEDLVTDYMKTAVPDMDVYAVCFVDETADNIPTFTPDYFIKAPAGTDIFEIRRTVDYRYDNILSVARILYPLNGIGGEFEKELLETFWENEQTGELYVEEILED